MSCYNEHTGLWTIKLEDIELPELMLREKITEEDVKALAESIKASGLLQPILVVKNSRGKYTIVDGCRRYHAVKLLGKTMIDAKVIAVDSNEALLMSIEANMQRQSLNPIEEARAYNMAWKKAGYRLEVIAQRIGKAKSYVSRMIKLLDLPTCMKSEVSTSKLDWNIAYEFLRLKREDLILKVYKERKPEEWTVKDARARVNAVLDAENKGIGYQVPEPSSIEEARKQGRFIPLGLEEADTEERYKPERCYICGDWAKPPDKTLIILHKSCKNKLAEMLNLPKASS
jgi:ParB/RepB/Spo0J family partition protein